MSKVDPKYLELRDGVVKAHSEYKKYIQSMPNARWDAVQTTGKRKSVHIERTNETGSGSTQLPPFSRLMAIAMCRDAIRNFSAAKSILRQIRLNVVGSLHEVKIDREGSESAEFYFNHVWSRNADFRSDQHISEMNGLAVDSIFRDGDCLQFFDHHLLGTGKLLWYESDQICDINAKYLPKGVTSCDEGVLRDAYGREVGWVVNNKQRGALSVDPKDCTIFRRDPVDDNNNFCKMLKMPWRFNQSRGIPELLTCVADLLDTYEMRAKELQSAKVAASMAGKVTKNEDKSAGWDDERFDPNKLNDGSKTLETTEGVDPTIPIAPKQYERFGALTGGLMEYMDEGEDFQLFDINRPNIKGAEFADRIIQCSGSSLGMAKAYSKLEASKSYTAFRGEMVMTWVMFEYLQNWLERNVLDWQAIRAIRYGIAKGLCDAPAKNWEYRLSWSHPMMPQVDGVDEQEAITRAIRNGLADLTKYGGPNWKRTVDRLAEQKAYCDKAGVIIAGLTENPEPASMDTTKMDRKTRRVTKDDDLADDDDENNKGVE